MRPFEAIGGKGIGGAAARLGASIAILMLIFTQVPFSEIWRAIARVSVAYWMLALAGFVAGHMIGLLKWRLLIDAGRAGLSLLSAMRCYFAGLFANLCLPTVVGGDLVRAGLAIRDSGERETVILGSLLDRILDVSALLLIALAGALLAPGKLDGPERAIFAGALLMLSSAMLGGVALVRLRAPRRLSLKRRRQIARLRRAARRLARRPQLALAAIGLGLFIQMSFVLINALLGRACGIQLPLSAWMLAWPLAKTAALLPVSLGGLGVREAALAVLLGQFGVPAALAVAVGLVWQTVLAAGGGLGGLLYLLLPSAAPRSPRGAREVGSLWSPPSLR